MTFPSPNFVLLSSIFVFSSDLGFRVNTSYYQDLPTCTHFEWLDEYIEKIEVEGASLGLNLPSEVEQLGSAEGVVEEKAAELGLKELKKMNKQLLKLVNLKKQDNLMAAIFYLCAIALGVVYVLIISH